MICLRKIYSFFILYLKILFAEKIALVWTVILPVLIAVMYSHNVMDGTFSSTGEFLKFMSLFWVFIIWSSYLNGVGLQLARLREQGLLKTYTLIAGNKYPIVFGTILSQLVFSLVSLLSFTIIVSLINNILMIELFLLPIILLICSLPFSLFVLIVVILPFQYNNFSIIVNLSTYPLFAHAIYASGDSFLSLLNPFILFMEVVSYFGSLLNIMETQHFNYNIVLILAIYLIIGCFSIKKLNLVSVVQR